MPEEVKVYPERFDINARLKARVGYRDSRVEIEYDTRIPLVGWYTLRLERADMPAVDRVFEAQRRWVELSMARRGKAEVRLPISQKVTAVVGFEDRRVEIHVSLLIKTYVIVISEADAPKVERAFAAEKAWNALPDFVREMKGAA